jgi:methane monooxygenase PmoA-like
MSRQLFVCVLLAAATSVGFASRIARPASGRVEIVNRATDQRVDISIDGQPFTSYIYPQSLEKPVLYPIRSAAGVVVTRGYPLEPRPGERADHPHHIGHWFNYGDVNGYDFWGNSSETPPNLKPKTGVIVHKAITRAAGGDKSGELSINADWVIADGTVLLREQTRFIFAGAPGVRTIDRTSTWTAADKAISFNDTKEGAFGIRVARSLDSPVKQQDAFVDADGKRGAPKADDNVGVTGRYIGSDGKTGDDVWGTTGAWMGLTGTVDGKPVTIGILNHPSSANYPTYWHARGYGLFAANPIGRHAYDPKQPERVLTLEPGKSATFRYRILIRDAQLSRDQLQQEQARFDKEK